MTLSTAPLELLVLPGDGIGPEITEATLTVLQHANCLLTLNLSFSHDDIGFAGLERYGHTIPDALVERARSVSGIVLGPCDTFAYPAGGVNPSSRLRLALDLYANIRPSRRLAGVNSLANLMDLVIVRENTEGFYADRNMFQGPGEFMPTPDLALAVRKVTREGSRRIARQACELAMKRRKKLTIVSKANVLKLSDGLFLEEVRAVLQNYPSLAVDHELVDAMASHLVRSPEKYDVIVTTNMFGDILSNLASELVGGLGLAGSINISDTHGMAQASHGSAPDIAGKGIANPCSLLFSAAMLLAWLGEKHQRPELVHAAQRLDSAVMQTVQSPATCTPDLGGALSTRAFADAVCEKM